MDKIDFAGFEVVHTFGETKNKIYRCKACRECSEVLADEEDLKRFVYTHHCPNPIDLSWVSTAALNNELLRRQRDERLCREEQQMRSEYLRPTPQRKSKEG